MVPKVSKSEDEIPIIPQVEQLNPYNWFWLAVFFLRRFVLPAANIALCAYLIYESYSSCTTYFIASTYSLDVSRYIILPLAAFSTLVSLATTVGMYINFYHFYQCLKGVGLTKWSEIAPHFDKLKGMAYEIKYGKRQVVLNLIGLLFEDTIQIGIAYYKVAASRVAFSIYTYLRVYWSALELGYSFSNFIAVRYSKKWIKTKSLILFLLFAGISVILSYVIPIYLVLYNSGINVGRIYIQTSNIRCYDFPAPVNNSSDLIGIFEQGKWFPIVDTCSYADNAAACPLFQMVNLTRYESNAVSTPFSTFDKSYYFSPVYAAYRKDGKNTESLLFELQNYNQELYCGNYGKLFPDNIHVSVADLSNIMSPNNTWEALSSYLKNVHVLQKLDKAIMYTIYQDGNTNSTYIAVSNIKISTEYICTLS
ncbi:hypothetical protein HDV01_007408 [Terramyces sp. JEL0728]|nr:hypothetical protein HDV01_007408 [Terramyces sp. JEL0728]